MRRTDEMDTSPRHHMLLIDLHLPIRIARHRPIFLDRFVLHLLRLMQGEKGFFSSSTASRQYRLERLRRFIDENATALSLPVESSAKGDDG